MSMNVSVDSCEIIIYITFNYNINGSGFSLTGESKLPMVVRLSVIALHQGKNIQ